MSKKFAFLTAISAPTIIASTTLATRGSCTTRSLLTF